MYIKTLDPEFKPNNFLIHKFYGKDTCFAWEKDELVVFPYSEIESSSTSPLTVIRTPGIIRTIQNFEDRIFIIFSPSGIYKLTEKLQFANLSKSGIGIGSHFSKVFSFFDGCINLEDKLDKSVKKLFQIKSNTVSSNDFFCLKLLVEESDKEFRTALLGGNEDEDVCLIAHNKFMYKLTHNVVTLIYNCDYRIREILPIERKEIIAGLALLTDSTAVILVYIEEKKLKYDKIYLNYDGTIIHAFCAKIDEKSQNYISFVYSTSSKTYQCRKKFNFRSVHNIAEENQVYNTLRFYKSDFVVGLTSFKNLCRFRLKEVLESSSEYDSEFVDLKLSMMQGTEVIVNKICEKAKELQTLGEIVENEKNVLKRINMFAYETREKYCPEFSIQKLAGKKYLSAKFQKILPVNSQVILAASCGDRRTFCVKKVTESETQITLPLTTHSTSKPINVTLDLIAHNPKGECVCLIKDFIKDPDTSPALNLSPQKDNFVSLKVRVLKNLVTEGKLTMQALSEIKNSIRRELRSLD